MDAKALSVDEHVRLAAQSLLDKVILGDNKDGDATATPVSTWMHPRISVSCLHSEFLGSFGSETGSFKHLRTFVRNNKMKEQNKSMVEIRSVRCLDVGSKDAAAVQVRLCGDIYGWLVFLNCRDDDDDDNNSSVSWRCISAAFSIGASPEQQSRPILPHQQWQSVTAMLWEGYCAANRACDGTKMLRDAFHATCRLTFCDTESTVQIKDAPTFAEMVTTRYETEGSMHAPYRHLKDDPRVSAKDTLLAIDFCAPDCCMVVLKVGHPPCLWTDLLTCACIDGTWWIVHKSSCHEEFLTELAT